MYEDDFLEAAYEDTYGAPDWYGLDDDIDEEYDEWEDELDPDYDVFLPDPYDVTDGLDMPSYGS